VRVPSRPPASLSHRRLPRPHETAAPTKRCAGSCSTLPSRYRPTSSLSSSRSDMRRASASARGRRQRLSTQQARHCRPRRFCDFRFRLSREPALLRAMSNEMKPTAQPKVAQPSISQMPISCSTTARPRGQQRRRAAELYPAVLLVGNVVISAVKPKVHVHCPFPSHIA